MKLIRSTKLREYHYTSPEKKTRKDSEPGDHFPIQFSIPTTVNSFSFLSRFTPGIDGCWYRKLNGKMVSGLGILSSFFLRRNMEVLSGFSRANKLCRHREPLALILQSKMLRNCLFFGEQFILGLIIDPRARNAETSGNLSARCALFLIDLLVFHLISRSDGSLGLNPFVSVPTEFPKAI